MELVIYFFKQTVLILLQVLEIALFARAILSWFDPTGEWRISGFLYMLTEPVILPVRKLCEKLRWFEGTPIDIPFLLTWLLLSFLQIILSAL